MITPPDWNWESYLLNNPDVASVSCSQNYAIQHWDLFGRREGLSYKKNPKAPIGDSLDLYNREVYIKNILKCKDRQQYIGVFFHLGNYDLWKYFREIIDRVQQSTHRSIDLYVTYQRYDVDILQQIKQLYPNAILIESLRGVDVGGQLLMTAKALELKKDYDYILKLHTKSDPSWRETLIHPLARSVEQIRKIYKIFRKYPNIGLIGAKSWIYPFGPKNTPLLEEICARLGLTYNYNKQRFLSGTIFWFRWKTMINAIKQYNIDLIKEYNTMELGYMKNERPTFMHSWERILSILIQNVDARLYGIT